MTPTELIDLKLKPALEECALHVRRLLAAYEDARIFPALGLGQHTSLTDEQVRVLDQLVFRFGKLQDAMGLRLIPALLLLVQEWRDAEPFLDKLNRAEKLGMVPSVNTWQRLRELRNQTAHEYPNQPERVIANLRHLVAEVPALAEVYGALRSFARKRVPDA